MRKLFVACAAIGIIMSSCNSSNQYKLTGKLDGMTEGKIYLSKLQENDLVKIDSTDLIEGAFSFSGKVDSPDLYYIEIQGKRTPIQIFLENSKITVTASLENLNDAKIEGSANQTVYDSFVASQKEFQQKQKALYEEYKKASEAQNQTAVDSIEAIYDQLDADKMTASKEFVKANPNSVAAGFIAYRSFSYQLEGNELEEVYNTLGENVKTSVYGVRIKEKIDVLKSVAVGQPAPDFTLETPEGTPFSLSSLKGKVVVIDFWASWCGPCRRENPHMVEMYNEVHNKGVEFLGVSLDKDKENWLKAIEDDQLTWNHVSDLKYWNSEAAKLYGVNSIPATVLIDQNGTIVAKKLFGDELKAEIEKLIQ